MAKPFFEPVKDLEYSRYLMDKLGIDIYEAQSFIEKEKTQPYTLFFRRAYNKNIEIDYDYYLKKIDNHLAIFYLQSIKKEELIEMDYIEKEVFRRKITFMEMCFLIDVKKQFNINFNLDNFKKAFYVNMVSSGQVYNDMGERNYRYYKKYANDLSEYFIFDDDCRMMIPKNNCLTPLMKRAMSGLDILDWLKFNDVEQKRLVSLYDAGLIPMSFDYVSTDRYEDIEAKLAKIDLKISNKFKSFLKEHKYLYKIFQILIGRNCDVRESFEFIQSLRKEEYSYIGVIEYLVQKPTTEFLSLIRGIPIVRRADILFEEQVVGLEDFKEYFKRYYREILQDKLKFLVRPLNLHNFEFNDSIRELTSRIDMQQEGSKMSHCVGGYTPSHDERFFHMETKTGHSTLQIRKSTMHGRNIYHSPESWNIVQHYGFGNQSVPQDHNEIAKELIIYLSCSFRYDL